MTPGKRLRQLRHFRQLRMIDPSVETQAKFFQPGEAAAETIVGEQSSRRLAAQRVAGVPSRRVANAAEALRARRHMGFEHRRHRVAKCEISVADNGCRDARSDCWVRGDLAGHRFEKLDFADRLQLLGTTFSIAVAALDGDGRNHVVAATQIDE